MPSSRLTVSRPTSYSAWISGKMQHGCEHMENVDMDGKLNKLKTRPSLSKN